MRLRAAATLLAALTTLAGCGGKLPQDVDEARLTDAVSRAVGDPGTCLLIGEAGSGRVVFRYNTHMVCGRVLASCEAVGTRRLSDLLEATAVDRKPRRATCDNPADAARTIAWASGPVAGRALAYAAVMDSERAFPSRIMAERIEAALASAGLSRAPAAAP